jgi:aryl-alcohol dehydrogenase-like predicted oxidoreductase
MRYRLLGPSGLRVSELCLGTMTFGTDWGWGADEEECGRIVAAFADAGGNFLDTANNYTDGSSERIVGELTARGRDRWVIATKYTLTVDRADPNAGGNHRKSLVRSLEESLRRLRTDYVDLLWLHMRDATTPIDEFVRALDDQVSLGKVCTSASRTRRRGSPRAQTRSRRCVAGRRSSPYRFPTASRRASRSASSCRWRPSSGSRSPPGACSAPAS